MFFYGYTRVNLVQKVVKSAKIDDMSAENLEAVFMLKYLSTTNPEIVGKSQ